MTPQADQDLLPPKPFMTAEEAIYVGNSALRLKQLKLLAENPSGGSLEVSRPGTPPTKLTLSVIETQALLDLLMEREETVLGNFGIV